MNEEADQRARVLIVDDEPRQVDLLSEFLTGEGYIVLTAYNGDDALTMIEKESPDVVLLDITMPGIDGREVLRRKGALVPIIMVTANQSEAVALETLQAGAFEYVEKPFDLARLAEIVVAADLRR